MMNAIGPDPSDTSDARFSLKSENMGVRVRLYVARQTPNSIRAEQNLAAALKDLGDAAQAIHLEIVDVFRHPRRAITDGIIVTPTVIILGTNGQRMTIMGDLADGARLDDLLKGLQDAAG